MKEFDLLPEWYKSSRRRQISYRTQYIALGGMLAMMMVWNFVAVRSVEKTTAEIMRARSSQTEAEGISQEFAGIKNEVTQLKKKADVLEEIDSKIDVAEVLAELSFLIDERIVLGKVEFSGEGFDGWKRAGVGAASSVRVIRANFGNKVAQPLGEVRFKVVISGVAADAGEVATLICRLEDSPYFCRVTPSFSQNAEVKAGTSKAGRIFQVSKFEISCCLANYRQQGPRFAKEARR